MVSLQVGGRGCQTGSRRRTPTTTCAAALLVVCALAGDAGAARPGVDAPVALKPVVNVHARSLSSNWSGISQVAMNAKGTMARVKSPSKTIHAVSMLERNVTLPTRTLVERAARAELDHKLTDLLVNGPVPMNDSMVRSKDKLLQPGRGSLHSRDENIILALSTSSFNNVPAENATTEVLYALGGGTGATIGGTGDVAMDRDLLRRMRYQDKAVMMLLLLVYFVTVLFSASFAYRQAQNESTVSYYGDPRYHDLAMEGHDLADFFEVFAQEPKDVCLHVTGFLPVADSVPDSVEWQGETFRDAFAFSLDLSPWIVREDVDGRTDTGVTDAGTPRGIIAEDVAELRNFLVNDTNDLGIVELRKEVSWHGWEELATNIKQRIRQLGFRGIISIHRTHDDNMFVYKNTSWANFMHSRATKVVCAISVLGWLWYLPYMWARCTRLIVRSRFRVEIGIGEYWRLIEDKLSSDGFDGDTVDDI